VLVSLAFLRDGKGQTRPSMAAFSNVSLFQSAAFQSAAFQNAAFQSD
jgi:hypothetical protein